MPGPFAITAATNTLVLDAKRQATTAFTVSNQSGRQIRGRARITPQNAAAASWLTLVGDSERDFPIAGTQQYSVQIAVPAIAPAGSYPFRLDVVGVDNPDEEYSQGPQTQFDVPAAAPKKPFPIWIPIAAVAALLLVIIIAFVFIQSNNSAQASAHATATAVAQATQAGLAAQATGTAQAVAAQTASAAGTASAIAAQATATQAVKSTAIAQASATARVLAPFVGTWVNIDPSTRSITKVVFTQTGGALQINEFASCAFNDCDWGQMGQVQLSGPTDRMVQVVWTIDTETISQNISLRTDGRLQVDGRSSFAGVSGERLSQDLFVRQ